MTSLKTPGDNEPTTAPATPHMPSPAEMAAEVMGGNKPHASPAVRGFARELGVDLSLLNGSGPHGRITFADVKHHVRAIVKEVYSQKYWP